jgi:hypothetical protein
VSLIANTMKRTLSGFAMATFGAWQIGCASYTRTSPEAFKEAIINAGVLGTQPDEAIRRLRDIHLANVQEIKVGGYLPDRHLIEVSVPDARRTWFSKWSVNAVVSFDSTHRAAALDVRFSADSPL